MAPIPPDGEHFPDGRVTPDFPGGRVPPDWKTPLSTPPNNAHPYSNEFIMLPPPHNSIETVVAPEPAPSTPKDMKEWNIGAIRAVTVLGIFTGLVVLFFIFCLCDSIQKRYRKARVARARESRDESNGDEIIFPLQRHPPTRRPRPAPEEGHELATLPAGRATPAAGSSDDEPISPGGVAAFHLNVGSARPSLSTSRSSASTLPLYSPREADPSSSEAAGPSSSELPEYSEAGRSSSPPVYSAGASQARPKLQRSS